MASQPDLKQDDLFCLEQDLLHFLVCVPESWDKEQIERVANQRSGTGISSDWAVDEEVFPHRVQCTEDPGRVHVLLNC